LQVALIGEAAIAQPTAEITYLATRRGRNTVATSRAVGSPSLARRSIAPAGGRANSSLAQPRAKEPAAGSR
jgi:hypothetical protein